jgi:bifunctional oligoribonuclease and PAP phosphatase NrnA
MYERDTNIIKLNGYILQNFEMQSNGVASVLLTKKLLEEYSAEPSEASLLVGTLGDVKGIKAWVFFIEEEDQIRVRLRSKGPVINGVARKFKGGGHPLASGASIHSWDEVEHVVKELSDVCDNYQN